MMVDSVINKINKTVENKIESINVTINDEVKSENNEEEEKLDEST